MAGSREEVVQRYATAAAEGDLETLASLRHPEWRVDWPQSGERVSSSEAFNAIARAYPGGTPTTRIERVVGSEDRWVVTPSNTVVRMAGSGDFWWGTWTMTYPDGACYHCIDLIELRDELVFRETVYWASPFERPAWRAHLVDPLEPPAP